VNPEAIIFATGAVEKKYDFEGSRGTKVIYLWDYLAGKAQRAKRLPWQGAKRWKLPHPFATKAGKSS
jgi:hypothetical protein